MRQFQITYQDDESLRKELENIKQWRSANPSYTTLFRVYSTDTEQTHIQHVCDILDEEMPEALCVGCIAHANLLNGALEPAEIILTCTVFEYETTQVKLLQFPFTEETEKDAARELKAYCDANPWVSAVEIHATILGMSMREFCNELSTLRSDIQVYGGGACNPTMTNTATNVFAKGYGFSGQSIVFLLFGGEDFHANTTFFSGWNPLRRKFKITKAHREILYELDGEPAFNVYQRFLNIENNDQLVSNTLEFPFLMDDRGVDIMRCLISVNDDNSLVLTSEIAEGSDVRLAFGDPEMILASIRRDGQKIADFQPDVIQVFSCGARRAFWGDANVSDETLQFHTVAPTSGFYTGGEMLRIDGIVRTFNCTLVIAAMREGEPKNTKIVDLYNAKLDDTKNTRITLIQRFISFIEASTAEFEELSRKLMVTSITDGLTSLYNRTEIERRIRCALEEQLQNERFIGLSLIMLDLDNFKKVNDTYGHQEGDHVIIALSDVLRKNLNNVESAYIGRWGGEEFMALLPGIGLEEAAAYAEKIRAEFAAVSYEKACRQTVSLGVVQAKDNEDVDALCSRVDKALYTAKANGKNQVVILN